MKIDCSKTANYLKEKTRMTNNCRMICQDCPISSSNNKMSIDCTNLQNKYPEQAIEIVQKWSDEHQQKTRLEYLKESILEKYPKADIDELLECLCVVGLGYPRAEGCPEKCDDCEACWNMPV